MSSLLMGIIGASKQQWPFATTLGNVTITGGTTNLANGGTFNYDTLTIAASGILNILTGSAFTVITAKTLIISGQITGITGEHTGGTFTKTVTETGLSASYTITQSAGGASSGGTSGGNGGGGAGNFYNFVVPTNTPLLQYLTAGTASSGGHGGNDGAGSEDGATTYSGAGNNGWTADIGEGDATHTGGGGGFRGRHGQGIILYANSMSGNGTISVIGAAGGAGGIPGPIISYYSAEAPGQPGGGGAGGSGGKIYIRYKASTFSGTTTYSGGSGGGTGAAAGSTGSIDSAAF
jgi:hypothetical protein